MKLIQFNKSQTNMACQWLVRAISELVEIEAAQHLIDDLSIALAVMRACHTAAPDLLAALKTTTDLLAIAACLEPDEFAQKTMLDQIKTNLELIGRIEDERHKGESCNQD